MGNKGGKGNEMVTEVTDEEPIDLGGVECSECKENLGREKFYKYQLQGDKICKKCCKRKGVKREKKSEGSYGLYVVTTTEKMKEDIYKVGKHSGSQRKLISRYRTYLIDPIIILYLPASNMDELEASVLHKLDTYRQKDQDSRLTEWVKLPLEELIPLIINELS